MLEPSPSTSGRDNTHRIESLARAVATIEREMSGMRKEYIDSTDGKRYEVLARYFGLSDAVSALELPFEIYVGSEVPSGGSVAQTFIGARDGSLDMEPITDVKEFSPSSGEWWLQAKIEINTTTGQTVSRTVEFVTTLGAPTPAITYLTLGKVTVGGDGTPQESSIQQFNYGPILSVKCGGVTTRWNVILY
jgi:hypothetical protein